MSENPPPYDQGPAGYPPVQQAGFVPQGSPYPPQEAPYPPQGAPYPPQGKVYPPQGTPYPPGPAAGVVPNAPRPVVVVEQPVITVVNNLGSDPARVTCPNCRESVVTSISTETSALGWLIGLGLCVIGCIPCCLIPCMCMDSMQNVTHTCPNCNTFLGRYSPGGL